MQEVDNALNQARKEIATRFDFKGVTCEIILEKDKITLTADNAPRMKTLNEILVTKMAKRNVPLQNLDRGDVEVSSTGHARHVWTIKRGLEHDKSKEVTQFIRDSKLKVTMQFQENKIRVTGKSRDDLQEVIAQVKTKDFGVALGFENYRN